MFCLRVFAYSVLKCPIRMHAFSAYWCAVRVASIFFAFIFHHVFEKQKLFDAAADASPYIWGSSHFYLFMPVVNFQLFLLS